MDSSGGPSWRLRVSLKSNLFTKGMTDLATALQGKFEAGFTDYLWKIVKDLPDEVWETCVKRLALLVKKPADLTVGDFMSTVREIRQERALQDSRWHSKPVLPEPDWRRMYETLSKDDKVPAAAKDIALQLMVRKERKLNAGAPGGKPARRKSPS